MNSTLEKIPNENELIYIYNVSRCNLELVRYSSKKRIPITEALQWRNDHDGDNLKFEFWNETSEQVKKLI